MDPFQSVDIFHDILLHFSALDLRRAACTCRRWRDFIQRESFQGRRKLLLVTVSGTNELSLVSTSGDILQRIPVSSTATSRRRKKRKFTTTRSGITTYNWPTCIASGPNGEIFVSQYKVQGLLEFRRVPHGLAYRRTFAGGSSLASPEGLVVAHNSVYVVSCQNATISRLTMAAGHLLEQTGACENDRNDVDHWTLWGMCISPDRRSLLIAGHVCEAEQNYLEPSAENNGRILRLDLEPDGSFQKTNDGFPIGFYSEIISSRRVVMSGEVDGRETTVSTPLQLNRPSNPEFCRHGVLHVTSFVSGSQGPRRRIEKFTCRGFPWTTDQNNQHRPIHLGWLEEKIDESGASASRVENPWGIAFSRSNDELYATTSQDDSGRCLVKFASCGCNQESLAPLWHGHPYDGLPHAISCCSVTTLVANQAFDQPVSVVSLH